MRVARWLVVALIAQLVGQIVVGAGAAQAAPANDDRANPRLLVPGETVVIDTTSATTEPGENTSCAGMGHTVWFKMPAGANLVVDTRGSDFDTAAMRAEYEWSCSDDAWGVRALINGDAGALVQVGGAAGASGRLVVTAARHGAIAFAVRTAEGGPTGQFCMALIAPDGATTGGSGISGLSTASFTWPGFVAGEYAFYAYPCGSGDPMFAPQELRDANGDRIVARVRPGVTVTTPPAVLLAGGTVRGVVTSDSGRPVGNACVSAQFDRPFGERASISYSGSAISTRTAEDGSFTLTHVPAGRTTLNVRCVDTTGHAFRDSAAVVDVVEGSTTTANMTVSRVGSVNVSVFDGRSGELLPNACASFVRNNEIARYIQAPSGSVTVDGMAPGEYRLQALQCGDGQNTGALGEAWAPGTDFASAEIITVRPGDVVAASVTLQPKGVVSGHVTRRDGTPVSGGCVELVPHGDRWGRQGTLAADGSYNVPAGRGGYRVKVYAPCNTFVGYSDGNGNLGSAPDTVVAPGASVVADVQLSTAVVAGTITKAGTGKPQACSVSGTDPTEPNAFANPYTYSNTSGAFELAVPPGRYRLLACFPRATLDLVIAEGERKSVALVQPVADSDLDGRLDNVDNCPFTGNADQLDADADDFGDACDPNVVSLEVGDVIEGNDGTTSLPVTVQLDGVSDVPVSARVRTVGGSATPGEDYTPLDEVLVIPPGARSASTAVAVVADRLFEADETIRVEIVESTLPVIASPADATIANDDLPPAELSWDYCCSANEYYGSFVAFASLSRPADEPVSFRCRTAGGTATAGIDYEAVDRIVTFAPGETRGGCEVPLIDDNAYEPSETIEVVMEGVSGAIPSGDPVAIANIYSDDLAPAVRLYAISAYESEAVARVAVELTQPAAEVVDVRLTTVDGSAMSGSDYAGGDRTARFEPGDRRVEVEIPVVDDDVYDPGEYFTVEVADVPPSYGGRGESVNAFIVDNDETARASVANASITEGDNAARALTLAIVLDAPSAFEERFEVATRDGSASAGSDYGARRYQLVVPAGQTRAEFTIPVLGDATFESDEDFYVDVRSLSSAGVTTPSARVSIVDNDCRAVTSDPIGATACSLGKLLAPQSSSAGRVRPFF